MKRARVLRKVLAHLTVLSTLFFRYFTLICAVMITCVWNIETLKYYNHGVHRYREEMYAIRPGDIGNQYN
jgi:hypothetical protein